MLCMYCMYVSIQHCFELRNYSAVMAIVVTGLGSPSVRRLKLSWEVSKSKCLHTYVWVGVDWELCVWRCRWVWIVSCGCASVGGCGLWVVCAGVGGCGLWVVCVQVWVGVDCELWVCKCGWVWIVSCGCASVGGCAWVDVSFYACVSLALISSD